MIHTAILAPRSISALQTALYDRLIKVESGRLNIVMGERAVIVSAGNEITINRGTMHAFANLSLSSAVMSDSLDPARVEKDTTVFAASPDQVYMTSRGPSAQITLSLYAGLLEDLDTVAGQAIAA